MNEKETCPFHKDIEDNQDDAFKLLNKKVPSWVFILVVGTFGTVFAITIMAQFNMFANFTAISSTKLDTIAEQSSAKLDSIADDIHEMKISQVRLEGSVAIMGNDLKGMDRRMETFEKTYEREHSELENDIDILKRR